MGICTAPVYKMNELNHLFIEMTSKNCNQRCQSCYIDFPQSKNVKDFISIEKIKETLWNTKEEHLYCIYLTGAEPMTHPDFNLILRLCLKRCNVCICTNSSFLNEKKIRFLKKVEDEGENQIFFKLSLAHYDELMSDTARYRGNYRQTMSVLKILERYNFSTVLNIQNFYNLSDEELTENFKKIFKEREILNADLKITKSYPVAETENVGAAVLTDCMTGRVLTQQGIYACPFLSNDYRGRVGASVKNYSKSISAETDFCMTCAQNIGKMFSIG